MCFMLLVLTYQSIDLRTNIELELGELFKASPVGQSG